MGQILAGSLLEPNFGNLAASGPQLKPPSGTIGKRPVLGQILAGSLLEPNFGNLAASGPQVKPPSGTIGKRPVLGQILAESLLKPDFGNLAASGPQVKPPSGTIGKRPVLGQILAGSLLEPNFGNLAASGPQLKPPSGTIGKRPVLGQILAGSLSQILAIWRLLEASGTLLESSFPETAVPLCQARGGQAAIKSVFQRKIFPVGSSRKPFLVGFELYFAFLGLWETARFGPNPGREAFWRFWQFGGFRAAIKTGLLGFRETARFGPNPGREPFASQILAIWRLRALGLKRQASAKLLGNGPFWAKSVRAFWSQYFGNLAASGPQLKPPSGTIGKRPVLGQILAGSLLKPDFGNLAASGSFWNAPGKLLANSRKPPCRCVKRAAAREHQGTSVFQRKIFPVERFEPETVFGHFELYFAFLKL